MSPTYKPWTVGNGRPHYYEEPHASIELWEMSAEQSRQWAQEARREAVRAQRRHRMADRVLGFVFTAVAIGIAYYLISHL